MNLLFPTCIITRLCVATAVCTCVLNMGHCVAGGPMVKRGIVSQTPAKGRAVKVDDGYMVPYVEKIPGTDVTFQMIPIPGGEFLMGSPAGEAERSKDEGPQVR